MNDADALEAFNKLKTLIITRQAFESSQTDLKYKKHPTTNSFADIHGETSLHYTCSLGQQGDVENCLENLPNKRESINRLNNNGETPIICAVKRGHNAIASRLHLEGAQLIRIKYCMCLNKRWFKLILTNFLKLYTDKVDPQFFTNKDMFNLPHLLGRAAEIGDIDFLKRNFEKAKLNIKAKYGLMIRAAENDQITVIKFLHEEKQISFDPVSPYSNSALIAAVRYKQHAAMNYLLEQAINIDHQNKDKHTALLTAVNVKNDEAVRKILVKNPQLACKDIDQENLLHLAVTAAPDFFKTLLAFPAIQAEKEKLLAQKNIYGYTPVDLANFYKNKSLAPACISQNKLLLVFNYYLSSHYQDNIYLDNEGICNGLNFLKGFYTALKRKDYFFSTLALLASWDGSEETLKKPLAGTPQGVYYKNLGELFPQWINDLIWFAHTTLNQGKGNYISKLKDYERVLQYAMVKNIRGINFYSLYQEEEKDDKEWFRTTHQIQEMFSYVLRMPPYVVQLEVGGGGHVTSLSREEQGLDYFDSNFSYRIPVISSLQEVMECLIDYKYIFLNQYDEKLDCAFYINLFSYKTPAEELKNFRLFELSEFPKSIDDAAAFHKASPNGYTHLHLAIITHSRLAIEKLLEDDFCDLDAKDLFDRTALEIAQENNFQEAVTLLSEARNNKQMRI